MKQILFMLMLLPWMALSQESKRGIQWTEGLSWEQVKQKARKENKYVFIDAFATWCGPCKEMDKKVYVNDTVGRFINDHFISVKVQMDKTQNDNEEVKGWYTDAQAIEKNYRIQSLPTYVFLSPDGRVVHKEGGYMPIDKFITTAAKALVPGQVYVDEYEEYNKLEADYHKGIKNYNRMIYMIDAAGKLGDIQFAKVLKKEYVAYLEELEKKQLYTKENLLFLGYSTILDENSPLFDLFYTDGKTIDKVLGKKGYAKTVVDRTIFHYVSVPFLKIDLSVLAYVNKVNEEADWNALYTKIRQKFSREFARRGVLEAKFAWYKQRSNYPLFYKAYLNKLDRDGYDTLNGLSETGYQFLNHHAWNIFSVSEDDALLGCAAKHMRKLIKSGMLNQYLQMSATDTYANLLYKAGKKAKAIRWEEHVLATAVEQQNIRKINLYTTVLSKMKEGKPTWSVKKN